MAAHSYRVVGAAILRVNLGGVRQVQVLARRPVGGHLLPVVDADNGLRPVHLVMVVFPDPGALKGRVQLLQMGNEILEQFLRAFAVQVAVPGGVVGQIKDVPVAVERFVNHIGMLDDADKGQSPVGHIQPILFRQRPIQGQDQ